MDPSPTVRLDPRLAEKKARLDLLHPLPPAVVQRLADDMRILLTYHSNAIEGNTLSLYETKMVIEEGVTISGQPLRFYLEARNHAEALDQVRALAEKHEPITVKTALLLHCLMMDDVLPDAGQWRVGYVHIRGDLAMLPFHGRHFEKIVSIHTFYFWSEPRAIFSQLVSLLAPGGRSVTTFATAHTTPTGERIYWPLHERAETLVSALAQEPGIRANFTRGPDSRQFNNVAIVIDKRYVVALKRRDECRRTGAGN